MQPSETTSRPARLPRLLLGLCLLLAAACDRRPALAPLRPGEFELLRRMPDAVVNQAGWLEPDRRRQWGRLGYHGWTDWTGEEPVAHVWSRGRSAVLNLPTGVARDRTLRITLFGPKQAAGKGQSLAVRLNGVQLASRPLPEEPTEVEVAAPAAVWRSGDNLLELEAERRTELASGEAVGLALSKVVYDERFAVELDPEREELRLAPQTAVTYGLEILGPTRVLLRGEAEGRGRLSMRLVELDPETGAERGELFGTQVELADQPLERGIAVPELDGQGGALTALVLDWSSDDPRSGFHCASLRRVEAQPQPRPPVIFITIDTLSAKHLPSYGYARDTAPFLGELAADATLFEHCESNAPWTVPSYMSTLTGLYAGAHRLPRREYGEASPMLWEQWYLAENRWTLAELLRGAGYATVAFTDHDWLTDRFGFTQGFDRFDNKASDNPKSDSDGGIRLVLDKAREWLRERTDDAPFFLFLHALDVHGPYLPPSPFKGHFGADGLYDESRLALTGGASTTFGNIHQYLLKDPAYGDAVPPRRLPTAPFADAYDESILFLDDALRGFFDELKQRGLYDSTLIVFSADHGESMDDSDLIFGHGMLDEDVLHVPLIVRLPGGRGRGARIASTVQLVDLYATLLDVVGLDARPYLHGQSLLPLFDADPSAAARPRAAYSEGGLMSQQCVVLDGWKLLRQNPGQESSPLSLLSRPGLLEEWKRAILPSIATRAWAAADADELAGPWPLAILERIQREGLHLELAAELEAAPLFPLVVRLLREHFDREELYLYDLRTDPEGKHDVAAAHPARVAELGRVLEEQRARMEEARSKAQPPSQPVELPAESLAQLKQLGSADD